MVHYFCPRCWREVVENERSCPHCGIDIEAFWRRRDYIEHLILALRHPEPQTPIRAAWILGQLRTERAVGPLASLVRDAKDVYIARAAVEALGRIGGPTALAFLRAMRQHPAQLVQDAVEQALATFEVASAAIERVQPTGD